jgi:translation initiation factor IF-2
MQTIASLANRLDMSADKALETLRMLRFDVADLESELTSEQTDVLIAVDEDPTALDVFLEKLRKKEEADRKRTERLQKAARAAAAKKKAEAKKKAVEDAEEAEKQALLKPETVEEVEIPEPAVEAEKVAAIDPEVPVAVVAEPQPETKPEPEAAPIMVSAPAPEEPVLTPSPTPAPAPVVAAPTPAPTPAPAPAPEAPQELHKAKADIVSEEDVAKLLHPVKKVHRDKTGADGEEAGSDSIREDGTHVKGLEIDLGGAMSALGIDRLTEADRRLGKDKSARPLPVPDPDVVRRVIEKAHERHREKAAKQAGAGAGAGAGPLQARVFEPAEPAAPGAAKPPMAKKSGKTAKKKQKRAERQRLIEDNLRRDAAAAVREYQSGSSFSMPKKRRKKRTREEADEAMDELGGGVIEVGDTMTVEQLADTMGVGVNDIILSLMELNILATKNQTLEIDMIRKLAEEHGFEVRLVIPEEEDILAEEPDEPGALKLRAPVITVMGHVDHGKTSLLDMIRNTKVAAGEAGGITQHIAAYDVAVQNGRVVFLDTPGHEAFTQMRARGAQVTDVVVLVVAADDCVKPQTIEAIDHARAANVPVVVAINKCDKPGAEPDRVRQELVQYELIDEAWGGKAIMRNISAKTGQGVDELLEMLVLESQMLELRANPSKRARGTVVESEISRGQGPVAWVLVQNGTLRPGDVFLCGETYGRVRSITNARGEAITEALPSTPVLVTGFNALPDAGDLFVVAQDERAARGVAEKRAAVSRQKRGPAIKHMSLEDFHARMLEGDQKSLQLIIKADVQGSVDVLRTSFSKLGNEEVRVDIVHAGVGGINESDIMLASASDSVVLGFHVTAAARVRKVAEQEGVEIRTYRIIYEAIEEVRQALEGMLTPESRETITGHAEIRQVFRSSAIGAIAGCLQVDGETSRGALVRLIRNDVVAHEGRIGTLRREKDDVRTVATGFECGIKLEKFDDIQVGDIIETYRIEQVAKTLE